MESLKFQLLIIAFLISFAAVAQYAEPVLKAFEKSYVLEKAGDFKGAAKLLTEQYQSDSYEFNLRLGWLSYNAAEFETSKNYYKKAIELMPYSEEAKFGLILPLSAKGEWNEIITLYQKILENSPGNTLALYRLGLIHYNRKDWALAHKSFQKVVDLYPFDYDGLLMLGWTQLQMGKNREARVLFNKVILYAPGDKSALEGLNLLNK